MPDTDPSTLRGAVRRPPEEAPGVLGACGYLACCGPGLAVTHG